ncbi:hypothetical protein CHUAL_011363 [Chamberlinius hualienensis]
MQSARSTQPSMPPEATRPNNRNIRRESANEETIQQYAAVRQDTKAPPHHRPLASKKVSPQARQSDVQGLKRFVQLFRLAHILRLIFRFYDWVSVLRRCIQKSPKIWVITDNVQVSQDNVEILRLMFCFRSRVFSSHAISKKLFGNSHGRLVLGSQTFFK